MHGPALRLIKSQGNEYTVRNASGDGRDPPSYGDDGTLTGVLEQRSMPTVESLTSGEEVESDLEIRAVDVEATIVGAGQEDYPTKLVHPSGREFEVLAAHPEDSGVTVLTVIRA